MTCKSNETLSKQCISILSNFQHSLLADGINKKKNEKILTDNYVYLVGEIVFVATAGILIAVKHCNEIDKI